jgi:hypothetical protein
VARIQLIALPFMGALLGACTGLLDAPSGPGGPGDHLGGASGDDGDVSLYPGTGRTGAQRLNNAEYDNTVHDLLGTDLQPAKAFVGEEASGFDNVASALGMTGSQYEAYYGAAEKLAADVFADPAKKGELFGCTPSGANGGSCLTDTITDIGLKAFRRPVTDSERTGLVKVYAAALEAGVDANGALQHVLTTMLAAPQFLYRFDTASGGGTELAPYVLASRLSYFLWSTMPDDELFAHAADGSIVEDAVLKAQVQRMLGSQRAQAVVQNFAGQWLGVRDLTTHKVRADLFPAWNDDLRSSLVKEAGAYFSEFLFQDRPLKEFFTSELHFVNGTLATHYGIADVAGTDLVRVDQDLGLRVGFLGLGSFLTMSSFAHRTSPTLRAKWVLEELLCSPVAPPPPGVDAKLGDDDDAANAAAQIENVRERLELHRSNPACAGCHAAMDPIGLGLENFDAIGHQRDHYDNGDAIDTNGELPGGIKFNGPVELANILADDPRFDRCVTQKMLTYALGRGMEQEGELVDQTRDAFLGAGGTLRALIETIVLGDDFRKAL